MWSLIKGLWTDEEKFKRAVRGVLVGTALGVSTAGGAEALRDVGVESKGVRTAITMVLGALGAGIGVGTQKDENA